MPKAWTGRSVAAVAGYEAFLLATFFAGTRFAGAFGQTSFHWTAPAASHGDCCLRPGPAASPPIMPSSPLHLSRIQPELIRDDDAMFLLVTSASFIGASAATRSATTSVSSHTS